MNGLDVAGLRPFDLVIPFTIQKGEITGKGSGFNAVLPSHPFITSFWFFF